MKPPLPTIDGVAPSCVRLSGGLPKTLREFLVERFPGVDEDTWVSRMAEGKVVDGDGLPMGPESPCREGAYVFYYREPEEEIPVPFEEEVLYLDDHILAADKPHFLPVTPVGRFLRETLLVRLKRRLRLDQLVPLHRIDRETAGVVLFSHNPETRGAYAGLFLTREVGKVYEALAGRHPGPFPMTRKSRMARGEPFFCMRETGGEPNSETKIEVMEEMGGAARYRLVPVTGRKHQLRVHLAALGIPLLNDTLYPELRTREAGDFSSPLKLVARAVSFKDPVTGEERRFESRRVLSPED